jgi:signal transduction histidine kinase
LRKSTSRAQVESSQWISVLDKLEDAISVHGETGDIAWANKALRKLYSKSLSELRGLSCKQVFHVDDSHCTHETVLATGTALRLDGEVVVSGRVFSVTIEPLLDERRQIYGFIRVMHDLTGERQARDGLLQAERFATLGQLFSGLAHDVGTPLNIISGYSEFLLMRTPPDNPGHKELSAILHQTRRIAALFEEGLDLARLPDGRTGAIDIESLLTGSLNLAEHHLRKAGVKAKLTCRISTPLIYGEASQFRQAFFNLLMNAGRQVENGGSLDVIIDQPPNMLEFLAVELWGTDAGARGHDFSHSLVTLFGAPSEVVKSGLGLSLAKDILDKAGARITFGEPRENSIPLVVYLPTKSGIRP